MKYKNTIYTLSLFGVMAVSNLASALELHVARNGNDSNPGTTVAPLATITAARDALRSSGKLGKEVCTVVVGEGVYRLIDPITFTPADSGSEEAPVVYRAAEGASVSITGAQEITSAWKLWKDGIYRTQVGEMDAVDQLFVNQSRQILARYPDMNAGYIQNLDLDKRKRGKMAGNVPYDGCADDAWHVSRSKGWADPKGAFMHGMHGGLWGSQHYIVTGQKADGSLIYEGGWQNNRARPPHPTYHMIENVFGQSWAYWVGLGPIFDREMQLSALRSLYRYNFLTDMGPFRARFKQGRIYALAGDAGLLMCTWPKTKLRRQNGMLYFYEFMTGFEWQVASHMIYEGLDNPDLLEHGLAVSRAIHDRYSAELRNPYNEIECGNHYARAMASYGAYQSMCGYQYHGPKKQLSFAPRLKPEDFRAAFTVAEGWGSFAQKVVDGRQSAELDLRYGTLELKQLSLGQVKGTNASGVTVTVDGKHSGAKLRVEDGHYVMSFDTPVRLSAGQRLEVGLK